MKPTSLFMLSDGSKENEEADKGTFTLLPTRLLDSQDSEIDTWGLSLVCGLLWEGPAPESSVAVCVRQR